MRLLFQIAASVLTPLLITSPVKAEMQSPEAPPQMHLSVVDRESETVPAGSQTNKGFTIVVADSSGSPVADAAVVLRLPDEGPSGLFPDASRSAIVYTANDGLAKFSGIKWCDEAGAVSMKITATKGEARAGMLLSETLTTLAKVLPSVTGPGTPSAGQPGVSVTQSKKPSARRDTEPESSVPVPAVSVVKDKSVNAGYHSGHKKWIILAAVVAAAAGAGLAMGAKGKSSSSSTSTAGISVGTPTVSVGQP